MTKRTQENVSQNMRSFAESTILLLITRIGISFGIPIILGVMVWMASTVNQLQLDISTMKVQVANGVEDRYHGSDAARDLALRDFRISQNQNDIAKLAARVDMLSARLRTPTDNP